MPRRFTVSTDDGFTLVEVLIASGIVLTIAAGVGHLVVAALLSVRHAREDSIATLLALQKIEALRAMPLGGRLSPDNALEMDVDGFVERLDAAAVAVSGGAAPETAVFVRRWRVRPFAARPGEGWVLQVLVTPARGNVPRPLAGLADGEALISAIRTLR